MSVCIDPLTAEINNLNVYPLEVVSRYRDPQLKVGESGSYFLIWDQTFANIIYIFYFYIYLNTLFIPTNSNFIG